jgi:molybdopterin converting factor small subunit
MVLIIKFIGSLRHISGAEELSLDLDGDFSIKELIDKIGREKPEFRHSFIDGHSEVSTANALVLVNGKEISALNALETRVKNSDEVIFVPVAHGG